MLSVWLPAFAGTTKAGWSEARNQSNPRKRSTVQHKEPQNVPCHKIIPAICRSRCEYCRKCGFCALRMLVGLQKIFAVSYSCDKFFDTPVQRICGEEFYLGAPACRQRKTMATKCTRSRVRRLVLEMSFGQRLHNIFTHEIVAERPTSIERIRHTNL